MAHTVAIAIGGTFTDLVAVEVHPMSVRLADP